MIDGPDLWDGVLGRLRREVPGFQVEAWARPLVPELGPAGLRLVCTSVFQRDRAERYLNAIRRCAEAHAGRPLPVELVVRPAGSAGGGAPGVALPVVRAADAPERAAHASARSGRERPAAPAAASRAARARESGGVELPGLQPPQQSSFDNFVVGPCNALAKEAALALAQGRAQGLFLASGSGLGKTHLARAALREAWRRGVRGAVYASAESFTSELMASIRQRSTDGFKRRFRDRCELLVLEDVQFLAGKRATQLELFHTVEHLRAAGRPLLLTASCTPHELAVFEPRMVSLLASGIVAEIESPDAQVRRRILSSKAAAGGVRIPADCLDLLVEGVRGSVRDLEGVLTQLVASSVLLRRPIDRELTEQALRKVEPMRIRRSLEPPTVVRVVAAFFGMRPEALSAKSRRRDVLLPRKLAIYLCHRYTDASIAGIGRALGREHTAVRNAIASVERALLERAPLRYQVEELTSRLRRQAVGVGDPGQA
jgi:chromosomal replication initiator protein